MGWRGWLPDRRPSLQRALVLGFGAAALAVVARVLLKPVLGAELPLLTFFPAILIASIWGGFLSGAVCLVMCAGAAILILPHASAFSWRLLASTVSGGLIALVGGGLSTTIHALRETQRRMEAAEARLRTLVGEMAHRNRNGLTVVIAMLRQSARKVRSVPELEDVLVGRLRAMADAQDEVVRGGSDTADLHKVLHRTLDPFDLSRFDFSPSPTIQLTREKATAVALVAHELATTACKYSALSAETGGGTVSWAAEEPNARLRWCEAGGPVVREPNAQGFGKRMLAGVVAAEGGRIVHRFESV